MKIQLFKITNFKYFVLGLFTGVIGLSSCIKDELNKLSGNITFHQEFSIPLGGVKLFLDAPTGSSTIGPAGNYYYNGLPYPSDFTVFPPIDYAVNFNLNATGEIDVVKSAEFLIVCENNYPADASFQIYLIGSNGDIIDQFFKDSVASIDAAEINANGEVIKSAQKVFIVDYNDMTILGKTVQLKYEVLVMNDTLGNSANPIMLTDKQYFKVTIGARIQLDYNIKDL